MNCINRFITASFLGLFLFSSCNLPDDPVSNEKLGNASSNMFNAVNIESKPLAMVTNFNSIYEASSGLLPETVCPPWSLFDTATPEVPFLLANRLILGTSEVSENLGYQQLAPDILIPNPLIIETRLKLVSGTTVNSARAPILITVTTSPNVGTSLYIGQDDIFVLAGDLVRGQSASVDTDDDFHTYRLEIIAGSVTLYYDGVPTLSGSTFFSPPTHGNAERVFWGEGSSLATGTSEWEFFRHNASSVSCVVPVEININAGAINCKNDKGIITIAIPSTEGFDATTVDHTTVRFGKNGTEAAETHTNKKTGEPRRHDEDADGDGDIDLVFHFRFGDTGIECGDEDVRIMGETFNGQAFEGIGIIQTVGN